jgi:hypothetical protein
MVSSLYSRTKITELIYVKQCARAVMETIVFLNFFSVCTLAYTQRRLARRELSNSLVGVGLLHRGHNNSDIGLTILEMDLIASVKRSKRA